MPVLTPDGISAVIGWDAETTVHDRRRILARELIAARLGCEAKEVRVERDAPRGFGYHTRLIASRGHDELSLSIVTASFRTATVAAICDSGTSVGIDLRDSEPDEVTVFTMRRHSPLINKDDTADLVHRWTRVQAVLGADGRGGRIPPGHVVLDAGRERGWLRDRRVRYGLTDASRDGWVITIAAGIVDGERRPR